MSSHAFGKGLQSNWKWRAGKDLGSDADLLSRILLARGLVTGAPATGAFLHPTLMHLHDPSLIPDLDRAAARILEAIRARERLAIYGDYDVDGVTATAILYHTIKCIATDADVVTYVPHRLEEGYGLNEAAMTTLARDGAKVIISVDCGITAIGPARAAREAGVDLIITDHHNPPATEADLPDAYAVVHPRRPGSAYPFADLSGAGVAYKLAWRLATMHCGSQKVSPALRAVLIEMLAFAALGAVADAVPLVGENRVIVKHGLGRVKHSPVEGLRALVEASGLDGESVDAEDAGFMLAPRLNACGRLGHAREAVELFTTATGDRAREIARELSKLNDQRKRLEQKFTDQACKLAEEAGMVGDDRRAIVLASPEWHAGVIGIVCSRLVEKFSRPTILMQENEGECHGSGRSIDGFSLHGALAQCASHLTGWGGHDMAAGMRLASSNMPAFADSFIEVANRQLAKGDLCSTVLVDTDVCIDELRLDTVRGVEAMEPCGRGNPRPRLLLKGARVATEPQVMGADGKHIALKLQDASTDRYLRVTAWRWGDRAKALTRGMTVDAVITAKISTWAGMVRVEGELDDLCIHEPAGRHAVVGAR